MSIIKQRPMKYNNIMLIRVRDIVNLADRKQYDVDIAVIGIEGNIYLRRLEDVEGTIVFFYDAMDELKISYHLKGNMICPCAFSLEDTPVAFDLSDEDKIVFDDRKEGFYFYGDMSLDDLVCYIVSPEAPIKVVKKEKIEYSRGDGWAFVSEEEYDSSKREELDPRLQKLKEYKFEEDD